MTFEEQYPSLNMPYINDIGIVLKTDVKKYCLDKQLAITKEEHEKILNEYKQKVKEAIEKLQCSCKICKAELLKELGL